MTETDFQAHVMRALNAPGRTTRFHRQNAGMFKSWDGRRPIHGAPKGASDLTGIAAPWGVRVELELKVAAPHTDEQKRWKRLIQRFGGIYVLARYDRAMSLEGNVAAVVAAVDVAIRDWGCER